MCNSTFYLKDGTPIKIGDTYRAVKHKKTEFGNITKVTEILVTEDNIKTFIEKGIILPNKPVDDKEDKKLNLLIGEAIYRISKKMNLSDNAITNMLTLMYSAHKGAAVSLLLKSIALILDEKYEDSIIKQDNFFVISYLTMAIVKVDTKVLEKKPDFQFFSAFRTYEDAETALKAINQMLTRLDKFKN